VLYCAIVEHKEAGLETTHPLFPSKKIEQKLRAWWKRKAESPLRQRASDPRKQGGTVFDIQPEVSSTETVEVFLEVEPLIGFKLTSSGLVKPGGYRTCDEFVHHFLPRLEAKFAEDNVTPEKIARTATEGTRAHAS